MLVFHEHFKLHWSDVTHAERKISWQMLDFYLAVRLVLPGLRSSYIFLFTFFSVSYLVAPCLFFPCLQ